MKTAGYQTVNTWIHVHPSLWPCALSELVLCLCLTLWFCFSLYSLQDWAWPAVLTRWWRYTRPPRTMSCCVCSEGSCAPTRIEWANWWERWWTTSHGQFHNQTPCRPHWVYPLASFSVGTVVFEVVSMRCSIVSGTSDVSRFDSWGNFPTG